MSPSKGPLKNISPGAYFRNFTVPYCGGGLSGICLLIIHFFFFVLLPLNPIISIFFKIINIPSLIFMHWKYSKSHLKILQKLLDQVLQPNWVIIWLNEILARFLRKRAEILIENNALNHTAP